MARDLPSKGAIAPKGRQGQLNLELHVRCAFCTDDWASMVVVKFPLESVSGRKAELHPFVRLKRDPGSDPRFLIGKNCVVGPSIIGRSVAEGSSEKVSAEEQFRRIVKLIA